LGFVGTIKSKFVNAVFSKPPTLELPGSVSGVIKPNGILPLNTEPANLLERFAALRSTLDYLDEIWLVKAQPWNSDLERLSNYRRRLRTLGSLLTVAKRYQLYAARLSTWLGLSLTECYSDGLLPMFRRAEDHCVSTARRHELQTVIARGREELKRHHQLDG
jgi:hypothetical protein